MGAEVTLNPSAGKPFEQRQVFPPGDPKKPKNPHPIAARHDKGMRVTDLAYPALHATHGGIWIAHADGRTEAIGRGAAIARAAETPLIMLRQFRGHYTEFPLHHRINLPESLSYSAMFC